MTGTEKISFDLQQKVGVGPLRVTWSAWAGAVDHRASLLATDARQRACLFCLTGVTPVGVSGDENATAGTNAVHIARDGTGRVHMIWQDGGRPDGRTGAVYRRAVVGPDTGQF